MIFPFCVEPLGPIHRRQLFDCGNGALNGYLLERASQDVRRRVSACFVARHQETDQVVGYYTLAMSGIPLEALPDKVIKKLPRYPLIPAVHLGRLAVDKTFREQGLGAALLWDAIMRVWGSEISSYAMIVDAKDDTAASFYRYHGFQSFNQIENKLFLTLTGIKP